MKNLVIGCRTLENELLAAMKLCEKTYTVRWIDARLHNVKESPLSIPPRITTASLWPLDSAAMPLTA